MKLGPESQAIKNDLSLPSSSPRLKFPHNLSNLSNNNSGINDEDPLFRQNRNSKTINLGDNTSPKKRLSKEERPKKYSIEVEKIPIFQPIEKKLLAEIVNSKVVELVTLVAIIVLILIVLTNTVLDDSCSNGKAIEDAVRALKFVELAILGIFVLEITMRVFGLGIREHFKESWDILDAVVIVATLVADIVDLVVVHDRPHSLSKVKGLFRLIRIFLILRKANEATKIRKKKVAHTKEGFKSPVERVIDLLESYKANTNDKALKKNIEWAIVIVSTNKLYEPFFETIDGKSIKTDANVWLKSYNHQDNNKDQNDINKENLSNRRSCTGASLVLHKVKSLPGFTLQQESIDYLTKEVNELHFDIMKFRKISNNEELASMMLFLFERHNFLESLNIKQETFNRFAKKVQIGYLNNHYHNATHAADVLQTTNYFLTTGELLLKAELTDIEVAALFIGSAIHDYDHPGTNNAFHINTGSEVAIRYNDRAVLENHHVSSVFTLLQKEAYNIFANFSKEDFKIIRERIIAVVLATDMSTHFTDLAKLKGRKVTELDLKDKDKKMIMETVVHAADISNPCKPWNLCKDWTVRIVSEFFDQGDKERELGLPISYLCDRYTTNIAKSQIGFIDFVVSPLFVVIKEILPKIDISGFDTNKEKWKELIDHYDQELKELNEKKKAQEALKPPSGS